MPSSASESIPYEIEFIRKNRPELKSVLDVGIGFGKGAFLIREYFDVKRDGLYKPENWKVKITGVEVYHEYLSELQRMLYDEIVVGDVFEVIDKLGKFELAILGDVIEHFSKEEGLLLLDKLFEHVEDVFVATPHGFLSHPAKGGNLHEEHKSGWKIEDFDGYKILDHAVIKRLRKGEELLVVYLQK